MFKRMSVALLGSVCTLVAGGDRAAALEVVSPEPAVINARTQHAPPVRVVDNGRSNLGGGLIEFLFGGPGRGQTPQQPSYPQQQPMYPQDQPIYEQRPAYYIDRQLQPVEPQVQGAEEETLDPRQRSFNPKFEKQLVEYHGKEGPGTIVIDTPNKFLYLVQGNGMALRYGIGVGRPGFTWSGVKTVSAKREWPDWTPPVQMLQRRPDLPRHMEGGPDNPLGARAMYLGSSLYRIHGSNEPWTIGTNVSSGCIRMRNQDVIDLYGRVNVGAKVIVI